MLVRVKVVRIIQFLSTPSARRATSDPAARGADLAISIHALREEGDSGRGKPQQMAFHFYPRPPRGGRPDQSDVAELMAGFLSTPSARRATWQLLRLPDHRSISIHALREEGDRSPFCCRPCPPYFYPRPPRGGRPDSSARKRPCENFYPRPPRGGRPFAG